MQANIRLAAVILLLTVMSACDEEAIVSKKGQPSGTTGGYDQPLVGSIEGVELQFGAVPNTWRLGRAGFPIRVAYRNAPPGAGLMVWIARDVPLAELRSLPESGGGLMTAPEPVEREGTVEVQFEGEAYSAPADNPQLFPIKSGRHVFKAQIVNHRRQIVGFVIRDANDQTLTESLSFPIMIKD